ncbi:MAG: hypothetical protein HRT58_18245 [Crocinitomicaceae bacterium]|nr:hypothetical protein [Flavobacteriales bacterium]NQZ37612.1 hypothetical protein [Crocinitomicaceae bacterium]
MKSIFSFLLLLFFYTSSWSQVKIGDNPGTIDDGSIVEIESISQALVIPRLTITQMNSVPTPLEGAYVYNTDVGCLFQYTATGWVNLCSVSSSGDITHSLQVTDHSGWYLLDGRLLSTLPPNAQNAAAALGLFGNLIDASGLFMKTKNNSTELLMANGGQNTTSLTQANLPNITLTGTTNVSGNHSHTYTDRGNTVYSTDGGTGNPMADNTSGSYTTGTSGNHSHTTSVNTGGSNAPIDNQPAYLVVNTFIYLGE